MKALPFDEVKKKYPEVKSRWEIDLERDILNFKRNHGETDENLLQMSHIYICKENDTPIYDSYMMKEFPGAIVIPYDESERRIRVGLITQERPIPNKTFIEVPRGFGELNEDALKTAYRELFEETGLNANTNSLKIIGRINSNNSFYGTDIPIIGACFKKLEEILNPNGDKFMEKILKVKPYSFREIQELQNKGEFQCGMSSAALFQFGCYKPEFYKN